ncbi:MAG: sugar phosphate isomerase/epimerase [Candidatus Devosia phytovorans]|uniref:Sugar phosphate isomerase/epimerase n=1 Tax=Candidatus Devosia phytovorans TaxID=3121372 RepID=A0AAJ5VXS8_9HYPH|nr:sugar phosphate isomerase/epimerase [Devosia sp.]WEK06357.1 MAG: sugar phosphate isomerase/epimerase [Devosia sp.]
MQKLLVLQSLWAMQNLRNVEGERSFEDNVATIKQAGFDGISTMWDSQSIARQAGTLAKAENLVVEGTCLPTHIEQVGDYLDWGRTYGLHHLNLQLNMRPRTLAEALAILDRLTELTAQADFPVYVETHRGRLTNDLLFMLDILAERPDLKLLGDLSHYVVAREIELPVSAETDQQISSILDHCWAFHGRVAGAGQVQLPLSFPQHQCYLDLFTTWWQRGFASWRQRAGDNDTLTFVTELGPQPYYAIAGADGRDLSDRWEEALLLRQTVLDLWFVDHRQ